MKNKRKTIVAVLLLVAFVFTTGTFAYWANYVEGTNSEAIETLTVGSAEGVDTAFVLSNELNSGGLLVPSNQLLNSNDYVVDTVYLSYDLNWQEDELKSQLEGTLTTGEINVYHYVEIYQNDELLSRKEFSDVYDLVNVEHDVSNPTVLILDAESETYRFEVTLEEPSNQEHYELISDAKIVVVFTFDIADNEVITKDTENPTSQVVLIGDDIVYVEVGSTYKEEGMIAYDSEGNEITNTWTEGGVDTWTLGVQTITYHAYSKTDNDYVAYATRTIVVVDTTAPEIKINGNDTVTVKNGSQYSDWKAWAKDNSGEEIAIVTEGVEDVDTSVIGTYFITYTATDSSGNESTAIRTIIVE